MTYYRRTIDEFPIDDASIGTVHEMELMFGCRVNVFCVERANFHVARRMLLHNSTTQLPAQHNSTV